MFAGKVHNLRHFGFRDFVGVDPTLSDSVVMDVQHDSGCALAIFVEKALEHVHHELHRGVVVIEQQHAVQVRPLRLWFRFGDDGSAGPLVALAFAIVIGQARAKTAGFISDRGLLVCV